MSKPKPVDGARRRRAERRHDSPAQRPTRDPRPLLDRILETPHLAHVLLDMPAWATLLGLIDECPVIAAAIGASRGSRPRTVSASAVEFISENGQIASVSEFMESLAKTLS